MLIRILEIAPSSGEFCFSGGNPQKWVERDWFRLSVSNSPDISTDEGKEQITSFIKQKKYYRPEQPLLVLHESHSFTIGYAAP